jgi:hypothetical protein
VSLFTKLFDNLFHEAFDVYRGFNRYWTRNHIHDSGRIFDHHFAATGMLLVDYNVAWHEQTDVRVGLEELLRKIGIAGTDNDVSTEFVVGGTS